MDTNSSNTNEATGAPAGDRYMTPIALIIGAIIIGGALYFGHGSAPAPQKGKTAQTAVNIKDVKISNNAYVGNADAPVTIAVWFDYQCPYCKMLDDNTLKQVYENYVKEGKVKIVYKDFAFLGPDSDTDALFARAVWDLYPEHFYEWYQAMFTKQDKENSGFGDRASVEALTKTISGIDEAKVSALVDSKKKELEAEITADRNEGAKLGIQGTPSVVVGNQLLNGVVSYSKLSQIIDSELGAVKK
ncbi:MAG TPA: hypothetical protein ENJ75_02590 [Candidatus Kaiserbacteria bacterium]|nr:hypothetical protein [Candidatus Kaiserbacteria bacterium]